MFAWRVRFHLPFVVLSSLGVFVFGLLFLWSHFPWASTLFLPPSRSFFLCLILGVSGLVVLLLVLPPAWCVCFFCCAVSSGSCHPRMTIPFESFFFYCPSAWVWQSFIYVYGVAPNGCLGASVGLLASGPSHWSVSLFCLLPSLRRSSFVVRWFVTSGAFFPLWVPFARSFIIVYLRLRWSGAFSYYSFRLCLCAWPYLLRFIFVGASCLLMCVFPL